MTRLRAARVEELPSLSALCLRSKAVHGYPQDMLDAFRDELTLAASDLEADDVIVAEQSGKTAGLVHVSNGPEGCFLEKLFVEPELAGMGIGRILFEAGVGAARARGAEAMIIESDPGATGFYEAMGARRDGDAPSGSVPGRRLPRLILAL